MPSVPTMKGARYIAEAAQAAGIDHVFFVDAVLRRALVEMEDVGIRRVLARSEKAAAYMADGYSRAARRPALCMAQAVGRPTWRQDCRTPGSASRAWWR